MAQRISDEQLVEELSRHGLRATRQRVAALRLLRRTPGHPTALEIHEKLLRLQPNVSQKTVYEILDALVEAGLASRVTEGGEPYRYEPRPDPHYHARCRVCARFFDVPPSADGPIRARAVLPDGFQLERIQVTLLGLCLRCRRTR
jgi:Fe2+ or Zn2+ uptake regulation protein